MSMNRRRFLRSSLFGGAIFPVRSLGFAQAFLSPTPGAPFFTDGFDAPTLGVKPPFTIMADVQDG